MQKATSKKPTRASWGSVHGVVIKNSLIRDEEGAPHRGSYEPPTLNLCRHRRCEVLRFRTGSNLERAC